MSEKLVEIVEPLVEQGDYKRAALLLAHKHPRDVAFVLERLPKERLIKVFKLLPLELQADALLYLDENLLDSILKTLSHKDLSELVEELDVDDAADILSELSEDERMEVLSFVPQTERREVETLLKYKENTAGGIMTTDFVSMPSSATVGEALKILKKKDIEVSSIYVVDERGHLLGEVYLRDLLRADPHTRLIELTREVPWVYVDQDQEEVVRMVEKYDVFSIPVVDRNKRLLGIVTVDDILDVLEEEISEDIYKLGGFGSVVSIFTPPIKSASKRLPWLLINLVTAFISASVVGFFRNTIESFVFLAMFMPVVAGMGGNGATQTLAMTVRSLALGEVTLRDVKRILLREIVVGIIIGVVVGLVTGMVAFIWIHNFFFGVLVFIALLGNMIIACMFGFLIPIVLKALGQDPALASGVIVTTFTDVTGFLLLLGIATLTARYLR